MVHEIGSHKLDNAYKNVEISDNSRIVLFADQKVLIRETDNGIEYPIYGEVKDLLVRYTYLFSLDEQTFFWGEFRGEDAALLMKKCKLEAVASRVLMECQPVHLAFAGMTAIHLQQWYKKSAYCGQCGGKTSHHASLRMMQCKTCGNMIFPRISPCIICAVTDGERLLVTQHAPGKGYALVAGFMEIGETAEECCAREVMEETGIHIKDIRYYNSQPWGCDGNMMFGFTARLDGSHHITVDKTELSGACWLTPEEIPEPEDKSSLTREMIRRYRHHELF